MAASPPLPAILASGKTWLVIAAVAIAAGGIYLAYWAMKKFLVKMDK